ncbi:diacylglycerol kinase [Saccharospirillum sp.]|uniref:diacylglycerol kinase n=1 Tax=Saccharospirillum sp. TaxID=2033801 RepID=UPI0034A06858
MNPYSRIRDLRNLPARGLQRWVKATRYSWQGLRSAVIHEEAFRQETIALLVGVPAALWIGTTVWQSALLIASLLLIMVVEMINSALEALVDRVSTDFHELSGRTKDMGSAAVLLTIFIAILVWGTAIWQKWLVG